MYNRNGIIRCETPICESKCPVGTRAICISLNNTNINDIKRNICKCMDGWGGDDCSIMLYVDYR